MLKKRFERENAELDSSFFDYRLVDQRIDEIRQDLDRPKETVNDYGVILKSRGIKYNIAKTFELIRQTMLTYSPDDLATMIAYQRNNPDDSPFSPEVLRLVDDLHMNSQLNDRIQFNSDDVEREIAELDQMAADLTDEDRAQYLARREKLNRSLANLRAGILERNDVYRFWFTSCLTKLSEDVMTLRLIQARARLEAIELSVVDVESDTAFEVARERCLDWMNMRSSLVDEWRNIEIVADRLRGDLSVSVSGNIANEGMNPINFSAKRANFGASVQFDAPLDRFLERNSYRQVLISYDQARRSYYQYVDGVNQQIRSSVRAIQLAQVSFELQRDSVLTAIKRVHSAQLDLTKPPSGSSRVGSVNTSAEALTNALENLLSSQNDFMQSWLQYQSRRMSLMLMLGVFELDDSGRWIDPGVIDNNMLLRYLSNQPNMTQDRLSGVDRLPTFEQLSGGRSVQTVRQMGETDVSSEAVPAAERSASPTYTFRVPSERNVRNVREPEEAEENEEAERDLDEPLFYDSSIGYDDDDYREAPVHGAYADSSDLPASPLALDSARIRR